MIIDERILPSLKKLVLNKELRLNNVFDAK
jgi:hypothetical protein